MEFWKDYYGNYGNYRDGTRNGNRQANLDQITPVIRLFFHPALGVDQGEWCLEHCEGLWDFANWEPHWPLIESKISLRNCCEFHFELASDAALFKLSWIDELHFTPEADICYNNFSNTV